MRARLSVLTLLFSGLAFGIAHAGDAENGADLFDEHCAECHSVAPAGRNKKGPTLYHVIGRKAGTAPGFEYSPSLVASGLTWSPGSLDYYLIDPKKVAAQGKMKFDGLKRPSDRADLIAYLASIK
jgi:cytochrome c